MRAQAQFALLLFATSLAGAVVPAATAADAQRVPGRDQSLVASKLDQRMVQSFQDEFRITSGDRIFFADGATEIGSRARIVLERQAIWLRQNPELVVVIEGHADDTASAEEMQHLALQRASGVRDRLIAEGVASSRIRLLVKSNSSLLAQCASAACRSQNRRVITVIAGRESAVPERKPPKAAGADAVRR